MHKEWIAEYLAGIDSLPEEEKIRIALELEELAREVKRMVLGVGRNLDAIPCYGPPRRRSCRRPRGWLGEE